AQDAFALESHRRAVAAQEAARFADELVPVEIAQGKGKPALMVDRDEGPRSDTSLEALGRLPPVFRKGGTVTAGNSSGLNDGAAALLLASAEGLRRLGGRTPLARVVASAVAGVEPALMGLGPIPASRKALARAGIDVGALDL